MPRIMLSQSGPFVVIDRLHLDRSVFEVLFAWAEPRGLTVQDAIQIALCFFNDRRDQWPEGKLVVWSDEEILDGSATTPTQIVPG